MRKIISYLLVLTLIISFSPVALAVDNFQVTPSIITDKTETKSINVIIPTFQGFNGAENLNEKVVSLALDAIEEANAIDKSMEEIREEAIRNGEVINSAVVDLDIFYDYVKEGDILSLKFTNYSYTGGAHGMTYLKCFNSNISTGEVYEFKDLFNENTDYNTLIKELIFEEIEKDPNMYFEDYKETISNKNGNYNFYIDGDKIVVYFDLYEIAAYASGIRQFSIDSEDIKDILVDKVFNEIKEGKERSTIIINGVSIETDKELLLETDGAFIPLRVVAESLGYKVDWNKNDGPLVDNKPIKEDVEKYRVIEGITYVEQSYFTGILGEYLYLNYNSNDELIVNVFSKDYIAKDSYDRIQEFEKSQIKE